jgi:hypothetical protein
MSFGLLFEQLYDLWIILDIGKHLERGARVHLFFELGN